MGAPGTAKDGGKERELDELGEADGGADAEGEGGEPAGEGQWGQGCGQTTGACRCRLTVHPMWTMPARAIQQSARAREGAWQLAREVERARAFARGAARRTLRAARGIAVQVTRSGKALGVR